MGRRRDDRVPVMKGIFRDTVNWYGIVKVRGAGEVDAKTGKRKPAFKEKRFPLAVPITDVEAWQSKTRAQLLEFVERGTVRGTFKHDAHRYFKDFTLHLTRGGESVKTTINPWIDEFGDKPRGTIKPADVARVRAKWMTEGRRFNREKDQTPRGVSAKTINDRVHALARMYRCLDGRKAWTPCDDLDDLEVHRSPIQFVDDAVIRRVDLKLQEMELADPRRSKKTRARHRVLMSTGRRPSELMRAEPGDVDLQRRVWLPRDGKGGFSPGIYLNDDILPAWELFIEVDAWGWFSTQKHAQRLRKAGWPEDIDPYQGRHTVGITLSERGIDLDDVGGMLGHKRRETTRKHYVPVLNSRMQKASEALNGRFAGWPTVQTGVQTKEPELDGMRRNLKEEKSAKKAGATRKKR